MTETERLLEASVLALTKKMETMVPLDVLLKLPPMTSIIGIETVPDMMDRQVRALLVIFTCGRVTRTSYFSIEDCTYLGDKL